jgi:hypothetical protein
MRQEAILCAMAAQVGLTFLVLFQIPFRRIRARRAGRVNVDDFKFGESVNVPDEVRIPNRNLMNLLEMPLLFYVACLTLYVTKTVDATALRMAWAYLGLRVVHSVVHLTYNKVGHRLAAFAASNVVLATLWIRLAAHLA